MRRWGVIVVGLLIALALLIAAMRQIGHSSGLPVFPATDSGDPLPEGWYPIPPGVRLGDMIAGLGPLQSVSRVTGEPYYFLSLRVPPLGLLVKSAEGGDCVRVHPDDEVVTLAVLSPDQPSPGTAYYPSAQPWAGFTSYCF